MDRETLLYHGDLGSLKQIADSLWKLEEELSNKGLLNEAFTVEGASRGIMEILQVNEVREARVEINDDYRKIHKIKINTK